MFLFVVDAWFLDKCEKFSHRTQRIFGLTCFSLARVCLGMTPIVFASPLIFGDPNFQGSVILLFAGLSISILYLLATYIYEKRVFEFSLQGLANPFKFHLRVRRLTIFLVGNLCMALLQMSNAFLVLCLEVWILLIIANFYFCSCDPIPPGKSKVRALIEKIRESLSPQSEPVSQES